MFRLKDTTHPVLLGDEKTIIIRRRKIHLQELILFLDM